MTADWSFLDEPRIMDAVETFGKKFSWKFGSVDSARHEAMAYIAEHPAQFGPSAGTGIIVLKLQERVLKYRSERPRAEAEADLHVPAASPPESLPEPSTGTYDEERVADLVSFAYGVAHETSRDDPFKRKVRPEVERKSAGDPSRRNTLWAEIADLRAVYRHDSEGRVNRAGLTTSEEMALIARYGMDMPRSLMRYYGLSWERADTAVKKITQVMNTGVAY